jgi:hypothetical protein
MTNLDSTPTLTAGALSADLLELAARLATQNPLPAKLAEDVAPVTATLLKRREARTTPARATV